MIEVNYIAVLVSGIVAMVLGGLWYSPLLFGKAWMKDMGWGETMPESAKKNATKSYAIMFVGSLVMMFVLAHFIFVWGAATVSEALTLGFWTWLGFLAPVVMGAQLWEGKPWRLFFISGGYYLALLLITSVILASWV